MEDSPFTLEEICMDKYVSMLEPFIGSEDVRLKTSAGCKESLSKIWWRNHGYFFTEFLVNMLFRKCKRKEYCTDLLLSLVADSECCKFTRADLSGTSVTDVGLLYLKGQPLTYLNITSCHNITMLALTHLLTCQPNLLELRMGNLRLVPPGGPAWLNCLTRMGKLRRVDANCCENVEMWASGAFSHFMTVTHLSIRTRHFTDVNEHAYHYPDTLFLNDVKHMTNLAFLDISGHRIGDVSPVAQLSKTLKTLIMYNCTFYMNNAMHAIGQLSKLQKLDLSKQVAPPLSHLGSWAVTERELEVLSTLEDLSDLDISAVILFETSTPFHCFHERKKELDFLGLIDPASRLCPNIPARVVAGIADQQQVLALLERYADGTRPHYIMDALHFISQDVVSDDGAVKMLRELMKVLAAYKGHSFIVDTGCILLYQMTSNEDANITPLMRRDLLELVVSLMELHSTHSSVTRACCFVLYNLKLPNDMDCYLERIINVLVEMTDIDSSHSSRRISVTLLNSCICHITLAQKAKLGSAVIQVILRAIRDELENNRTGAVLNNAWSTLWNITDETPANSKIFIENGGLDLFHECLSSHYDELDLMRTILGMIGNVVEVTELHPHLLKQEIVAPIYGLLYNERTDLETRYNVCGILCNLAGTNADNWTFAAPTRNDALRGVEKEVDMWEKTTRRQMSYISFRPLLRLLDKSYPFQSHYWVVWALCNFCHCDAQKYAQMLVNEGGVALLQDLVQSPAVDVRIRRLAEDVLAISSTLVSN